MCPPSQNRKHRGGGVRSPSSPPPTKPSPLAFLAMGLVQLYRHSLSAVMGRQCRYLPTCSEYALNALRLHGFWAGSFMTLARFCRCGPFGGHGYDPVPPMLPDTARWWLPWRYGIWRGPREGDGSDIGIDAK
ncbi:MAG: membrane protein insertion efficiency factor YidD [Hyphomicrobiales bacterium]|nr:membrane protein insertion efficiency factor YidD [Hyphomicrobiales bacterium]